VTLNVPVYASKTLASSFTDEEYAKFCEFFYRKTGISFNGKKRYFVERRLLERMAEAASASFRDYFGLLRFQASGTELQCLVNLMTVNETYFFREDYQFEVLTNFILPEVVRARRQGDHVRIWSMPCSTGEEPYSIALHILENWARADEYAIEILGSDIDSRVLEVARAGIYGFRSLQRLSPDVRGKYFSKISGDSFQLRNEIRESVDFSLVNIIDPLHTNRYRQVDVIFCRNLLIYFDDASRRQAVEYLYECLNPGGFICLGHSESMSRISPLFGPRKFADTIVYQKPIKEGLGP